MTIILRHFRIMIYHRFIRQYPYPTLRTPYSVLASSQTAPFIRCAFLSELSRETVLRTSDCVVFLSTSAGNHSRVDIGLRRLLRTHL